MLPARKDCKASKKEHISCLHHIEGVLPFEALLPSSQEADADSTVAAESDSDSSTAAMQGD
eukprot:scaffold11193_cov73-Skeletonema_dohrnii-CCMP3373.AAC.1